MPLYCLYCLDDPQDGAARRAATRPAHLEWAARLGQALVMAGPLIDEAGSMIGSVLLLNAENRDEALRIHASDPYCLAGVFGQVRLNETRWTAGVGWPS